MDILGIGGMELVVILIIMLVVAGPQRMIRWAYIGGQYVAKLRLMWRDVMASVQKEIDAAGLDIQVPKDIPTRQTLNRSIAKAFDPMTRPLQDTLNETRAGLSIPIQPVKPVAKDAPAPANPSVNMPINTPVTPPLGTWSQTLDSSQRENGKAS